MAISVYAKYENGDNRLLSYDEYNESLDEITDDIESELLSNGPISDFSVSCSKYGSDDVESDVYDFLEVVFEKSWKK